MYSYHVISVLPEGGKTMSDRHISQSRLQRHGFEKSRGLSSLRRCGGSRDEEELKERRDQTRQKLQAELAASTKRREEGGAPAGDFNSESWGSITTEELAAQLVRFAQAPVIDETGLTGKYSVTIKTSKNADAPGGTVFDAVEKLGLKLEPRKVTVATLVVDQVSKTPTAN